jgi:Arc/MetJ-type ribon-helix-helix transcriptional regulator
MTITVRLPVEVESKLRARLDRSRAGLSEFVREAIAEKLQRKPTAKPSAYEIGKHLFGKRRSGRDDLSTNRKAVHEEILSQASSWTQGR